MPHLHVTTPTLDIAYETGGPAHGQPVLLLHGWPDDVRAYDGIVPVLNDAGLRTIVPWLRGFGPTRFRSSATPRTGQMVACAQDTLDLMDALGLDRVAIVGHDWGARIAYIVAALQPRRVTRLATMSVAWTPGPFRTPSLEQARAYWYQWFMATERGAAVVRERPVEFARFQWDTWSPPGWFDEATFAVSAPSFLNPDWPAVTVHAYRVRWDAADPDPHYHDLEQRQRAVRTIDVPTLLLHGAEDRCVPVSSTAGADPYFTAGFERRLLPGVGHFVPREAPARVAAQLRDFLT
jgi:pimeloyl-ACP methyl ester carboxylesterase